MTQKIVSMAVDLYHGRVGNFSQQEVEENLREAMRELLDGHKNVYRAFRAGGSKFFTVMEEILDTLIVEGLQNQFDPFVDLRTPAFGDKPVFMVDDYNLFKVATIASGNNTIRRQRLNRQGFTVPTEWKGVKIYEELENFLAGRVNWAKLVQKVYRSHEAQLAADISSAIVASYNGLASPYKETGTYDLTKFNTLVQHVEAATGMKVMVAGTKLALQKVAPANIAYNGSVIEDRNTTGFYSMIDGTTLYEIKQAHIPGTDTFAISDNQLLFLPQGEEKIVKVVAEGDVLIDDSVSTGRKNQDDSIELEFKKKYGVGVVTSSKYGVYLLS